MTLQQLRYFVSVAHNLSFSRAAEKNFISQTAISQQIKLLERELEVQLLERTHHWVRLTAAGKVYYEASCQILRLVEEAGEKARQTAKLLRQPLEIGVMHGLEGCRFQDVLLDFHAQEPGVVFHFHHGSFEELCQSVQNGQMDLAVLLEIYPLKGNADLCNFHYEKIRHFAVLNRQSHLACCESLTREQLKEEQFCTQAMTQTGWTIFSYQLEASGLATENTVFADSLEAILLQISFHGGYTVLAEPIVQQISMYKNIVLIPLKEDYVMLDLIWNRRNENPALQGLLKMAEATE